MPILKNPKDYNLTPTEQKIVITFHLVDPHKSAGIPDSIFHTGVINAVEALGKTTLKTDILTGALINI